MKPKISSADKRQISLSKQQEDQIKEVFNLFDTDGGGTIDREELKVAMTALGFQDKSKVGRQQESERVRFESIDADRSNSVCLEEFRTLMKGELVISDPMEEVRAIFKAISCVDGNDSSDTITLNKLRTATHKFKVHLSEKELQIMMSEAKGDQQLQTIEEADFLRLMSLSPWF